MVELSPLAKQLINQAQKISTFEPEPFAALASQLNCSEQQVFTSLAQLAELGVLSRFGAVVNHKQAGASALIALSTSAHQLDEIANIVNQFQCVNHNYAREHHYNLWFVANAENQTLLNEQLEQISHATSCELLVLPMVKSFHLDLGFTINFDAQHQQTVEPSKTPYLPEKIAFSEIKNEHKAVNATDLTKSQKQLVSFIAQGLPLSSHPYQAIAEQLGLTEQQICQQLQTWLDNGFIRRFGLVIKHRALGYRANAMVVWNVPEQQVDKIGQFLAKQACVTLCYQRPKQLPHWPFNLFCMIHGKSKQQVLAQLAQLTEQPTLTDIEHQVLFSTKAYKQRGAQFTFSSQTSLTSSSTEQGVTHAIYSA